MLDPEVQAQIETSFRNIKLSDAGLGSWNNGHYFDRFQHWIVSSGHNKFTGLESFNYKAYSCGTRQAIESFVIRHGTSRRLRFSRGEFSGAKICANHASMPWAWLEDDEIRASDSVLISFPFCGNGNQYENFDSLLDTCDRLAVPVFVDAAYFGISYGCEIDLSRPCITDVAFSLSKPFSTPLRLGYRLTKQYHDDNLQVASDLKMYNRFAVRVGMDLLDRFSHDWVVEKYKPRQHQVCQDLDLSITPTVTLAIDPHKRDEFLRNNYYRICITDELQQRFS